MVGEEGVEPSELLKHLIYSQARYHLRNTRPKTKSPSSFRGRGL
jgi:hypothetical protein